MNYQFNPNDLVTTEKMARQAGISKLMVIYHIHKGKLQATRVGGRFFIMPEDSRDYLNRRDAGEFKRGRPRKDRKHEPAR